MRCTFCGEDIWNLRLSVAYIGKRFHRVCFEKVRSVAQRTGAVL